MTPDVSAIFRPAWLVLLGLPQGSQPLHEVTPRPSVPTSGAAPSPNYRSSVPSSLDDFCKCSSFIYFIWAKFSNYLCLHLVKT